MSKINWKDPDARRRYKSEQWSVKNRSLAKDLRILDEVIRGIRYKLNKPERNRGRALAAYHKNAKAINTKRRVPVINGLHRAALKMGREALAEQNPALLEKAFRKVMTRAINRAEQKIRKRLCSRFGRAMKVGANSTVVTRMAGTSFAGVRGHLEALFVSGMTWDNHGYGPGFWNIDHIQPLASFKLSDPEQAKQAFHFTNLQPLWHEANMEKRDCVPR